MLVGGEGAWSAPGTPSAHAHDAGSQSLRRRRAAPGVAMQRQTGEAARCTDTQGRAGAAARRRRATRELQAHGTGGTRGGGLGSAPRPPLRGEGAARVNSAVTGRGASARGGRQGQACGWAWTEHGELCKWAPPHRRRGYPGLGLGHAKIAGRRGVLGCRQGQGECWERMVQPGAGQRGRATGRRGNQPGEQSVQGGGTPPHT